MFFASLKLSPVAPVLDWRSEPAKSTRFNFPTRTCSPPTTFVHSTVIVKIECDLDEASLFNTHDGETSEYSIGCLKSKVKNFPEDCAHVSASYALRDIYAGEELVTDYDEFTEESWSYFGL